MSFNTAECFDKVTVIYVLNYSGKSQGNKRMKYVRKRLFALIQLDIVQTHPIAL